MVSTSRSNNNIIISQEKIVTSQMTYDRLGAHNNTSCSLNDGMASQGDMMSFFIQHPVLEAHLPPLYNTTNCMLHILFIRRWHGITRRGDVLLHPAPHDGLRRMLQLCNRDKKSAKWCYLWYVIKPIMYSCGYWVMASGTCIHVKVRPLPFSTSPLRHYCNNDVQLHNIAQQISCLVKAAKVVP